MKTSLSCALAILLIVCSPSIAYASGGGGEEGMVIGLFAILAGNLLLTGLAYKAGFPPILGHLAAGMIIGNLVGKVNFFHGVAEALNSEFLALLGSLGIIFLMFEAGLEGNLDDIKKNGKSAVAVAVLGVVFVGLGGYGVSRLMLPSRTHWLTHVFVAAALTPTSAGIGASIFGGKKVMAQAFAVVTLVAAVVDDILGLVILSVMDNLGKSVQGGGSIEILPLLAVFGKAVGFLLGGVIIGRWLAPRFFKSAFRLNHPEMLLPSALTFALFMAVVGLKMAGLAALIGAYVGGLILEKGHYEDMTEESHGDHQLEHAVKPLRMLMAPIFFFLLGAKVPASALINPQVLGLAAALTVACLIAKFISALGVMQKGVRKLPVVFGMTPRGEVAAIMVAAGAKIEVAGKPLISQEIFTAFVVMILLTTLVTIFGLNKVVRPEDATTS